MTFSSDVETTDICCQWTIETRSSPPGCPLYTRTHVSFLRVPPLLGDQSHLRCQLFLPGQMCFHLLPGYIGNSELDKPVYCRASTNEPRSCDQGYLEIHHNGGSYEVLDSTYRTINV